MRILCLFIATAALALAQLDSDTITITATGQTPVVRPDELNVSLSVYADSNLGLDDVLKGLAGVAVSERNLTGVTEAVGRLCISSAQNCNSTKSWTFAFTTPLTKLNETMRALASINAARQPGISISYFVTSNASAATQDCAYPTLISQAQRHAQNIAATAGLRVGAILAMSDGGGLTQPDSLAVPLFGILLGSFSQIVPTGGSTGFLPVARPLTGVPASLLARSTSPVCAAVVQFKLLR